MYVLFLLFILSFFILSLSKESCVPKITCRYNFLHYKHLFLPIPTGYDGGGGENDITLQSHSSWDHNMHQMPPLAVAVFVAFLSSMSGSLLGLFTE